MIDLALERLPELWVLTGEHLMLTAVSTGSAIVLGVPLGVLASRVAWLRGFVTGAVGILQTIPSLAMLAFLLTLLQKIGAVPAIIALTLYALLPIVRNTLTGLEGVSPDVLEAAMGLGMRGRQTLWIVKLPLATPVILAGIRTAAVIGVGIATLAAFIGAGGLGDFIVRGLALSNTQLILLGAIPAALLALLVDNTIAAAEWGLQRTRQADRGRISVKLKPLARVLPLVLLAVGLFAYFTRPGPGELSGAGGDADNGTIRIGSKNFTEQFILGELMAQIIEARTDLSPRRRFNLGGTMIVHGALTGGEVDLYAEYTGTALTVVLDRAVVTQPERVRAIVRREYRDRFDLLWLRPFGFDNTYALAVRRRQAEREGWVTISDLAPHARRLEAGFTGEFVERPDGYAALRDEYGFAFGRVRDMDPALMYEAVATEEVDAISAFATDGRIPAYDLVILEDDRQALPPYEAAPVVRLQFLQAHPEVREALEPLAGLIDESVMRRLNFQVDEHKRSPRQVARDFLQRNSLLE